MRIFRKGFLVGAGSLVLMLASAGVAGAASLPTPVATGVSPTSASVSFTADSGFVAVAGASYVVTSSPGALTCSVPNAAVTLTGSQSCTVSGLSTGTAYTFTVAESGGTPVDTVSAASNSITLTASTSQISGAFSTEQTTLVGYLGDAVTLVLALLGLGVGIRFLVKWVRKAAAGS